MKSLTPQTAQANRDDGGGGAQHRPRSEGARSRLRISVPGDAAELAADRLADRAMTMPPGSVETQPVQRGTLPGIQRRASAGGDAAGATAAAVDRVVNSPGLALDQTTRDFFEPRFGHDFGHVRIHADSEAAHSARAVAAHAYAVGGHVVFGEGRYAPHSPGGRRLLAHELAHVVQQDGAGGSASDPTILRDTDEAAEKAELDKAEEEAARIRYRKAELDRTHANLVRSLTHGTERSPPDTLIPYATTQAKHYADAVALNNTESRLALASLLTTLHTSLVAQEQGAERDTDGSLLLAEKAWGASDEPQPWTDQRPRSLAEIPPFSAENVAAWQTDAMLDSKLQSDARAQQTGRSAAKPSSQESAPPPLMPETEVPLQKPASAPVWDFMEGGRHEVTEQAPTAEEKAGKGLDGGGKQIRDGLAALGGQTLAGAGVTKTRANADDTPEVAKKKGETSLLDASAQIWFISNRLYILDRTGHLLRSEDVWFDVSAVRGYQAGGVYFLAPIDVVALNQTFQFEPFAVSGHGFAKKERAGIYFPRVLTAYIPVEELRRSARDKQAGIGLIVAESFGKKQQSVGDLDFGKLADAVNRAPGHLEWAVRAEAARILDDPGSEVLNQLMGVGGSYLARLLPPVGAAMFMYQALKTAQWLGEVGNIAIFAQSEDEIDIAAQAIARKIASFVISEAISRGIRVSGKGLVKLKTKVGSKGGTAGKPSAKSETPSKPAEESSKAPPKNAGEEPKAPGKTPAQEAPAEKQGPIKHPAQDAAKDTAKPKDAADTPRAADAAPAQNNATPPQRPKQATPDVEPTPKPRQPSAAENEAMRAGRERVPDAHAAGKKATPDAPHTKTDAPAAAKPDAPAAATVKPDAAAAATAKPDASAAQTAKPAAKPAAQSASPPAQPKTPAKHTIDDVLTADRKGIAAGDNALHQRLTAEQSESLLRLQAAYRKYQDRRAREKVEALPPEEWLRRVTIGEPRKDAENLFGPDYARTGRGGSGPRPGLRIADVPRPQAYDDVRFKSDLASVRDNPAVWDRLKRLRENGVAGGEVDPGVFQILKGNIAEVLARPLMDSRLAEVKAEYPDARLEFGTRIARVKAGGGHETPVLFSDGLIVSGGKGAPLKLHDTFEVKAGSHGGAEATTQFHEWREGRLSTGDKLVLTDGQSFTIKPNAQAPGQVGGMQTATPHLVAARGAEVYGTGSADQVAVPVTDKTRHALGQTASEIEYLARVLLEGLPKATPKPKDTP